MTPFILSAISAVAGFGVGAAVSYLFFRANPKKKSALDAFVDKNKP